MKRIFIPIIFLAFFSLSSVALAGATFTSDTPSFQADLVNTLDLQSGVGKATFTRADASSYSATVTDFEGLIRPVKSGEARFEGARRVENLVAYSEDFTNGVWAVGSALNPKIPNSTDVRAPDGTYTACKWVLNDISDNRSFGTSITLPTSAAGRTFSFSYWVYIPSSNTGGTFTTYMYSDADIPISEMVNLNNLTRNTWQRVVFKHTFTSSAGTAIQVQFHSNSPDNVGDMMYVWHPQVEEVTGQGNQNPSEYVSTNVKTASPYHGAGVDGVKYFKTYNGNTVASNVVTERTGAAIPDATLHGYLAEGARTNTFKYSEIFGNPIWTASNITLSASTTAPSGATTAPLLTAGANDATLLQAITGTAASWTMSVYLKRQTGTGAVSISADGTNFTACTVTSTEWTRCSDTRTLTAASYNGTIKMATSGDAVYAWGAQLEAGAFASSYIPTTSAAVTRAADSLKYPLSQNIPDPVNSFSMYFEFNRPFGDSGFDPGISPISIAGYTENASLNVGGYHSNASVLIGNFGTWTDPGVSYGTYVHGRLIKNAFSFYKNTNSFHVTKDGAVPVAGNVSNPNYTTWGATKYIFVGGAWETVRNVKIWKKALPDATLQNLTSTSATASRTAVKLPQKINANTNTKNASGLVGLWSFDAADVSGTSTMVAYDRSGYGNNGTTTGAIKVAGKLGQGLSFDGVDDYVKIPDSNSIDVTNNFTISLWAKYRTPDTTQTLVGKKSSWDGSDGFYIERQSGKYFVIGTGTAIAQITTSHTANTWYHLVFIISGTSVSLYINGTNQAVSGSIGSVVSNNTDLTIGQFGSGTSYFNGSLDDIRIYNRALSATEVKKLYSAGAGKVNVTQNTKLTSGLVGLWSFDGPDLTDKVYDRSGNGNNGYLLSGATTTAKVAGKLGQGLNLNGTNNNVIIQNTASLRTIADKATFSLWVKPSGSGANKYIFIEYNTYVALSINAGNNINFKVYTNSAYYVASTATISPYTWNHITGVYDGSQIYIYINGVRDANSTNATGNIDTTSPNWQIGGYYYGVYGGFFNGSIDDVRIYNRALTATEIKQLYNAGK